MSSSSYVIACDIGGTTTRVSLVHDDGVLRDINLVPTPASPSALVRTIVGLADKVCAQPGWRTRTALGAGIAVPAAVHPESSAIGPCSNLPGLEGFPLRSALQEALRIPVTLENDANAAALGELTHGAAKDMGDFALVIVGTGVGMGAVINGQLLRGSRGSAGEIGLARFESASGGGGANPAQFLHELISGPAVQRMANSLRDRFPDSTVALGASATDIFSTASSGDPLGQYALTSCAEHLAQALQVVISVLDPSLVLLGGGVGSDVNLIRAVSQRVSDLLPAAPTIRGAQLSQNAGLVGAATAAWAAAV